MAEVPLVDKWSKTFIKNEDDTYTLRCSLIVGDIQIGAVEIKDGETDTRAVVGDDGLEVEIKKSILPTGAATSDNQTDGSQRTQIDALATIYNGSKTVPTGTAEAIATTQVIHSVTVKALSTNTVAVYVGASGVTTSTGIELLAGESISLDVTDLATVFVISGSASQVVRYIGL